MAWHLAWHRHVSSTYCVINATPRFLPCSPQGIKLKFHGTICRAASSWYPREDVTRKTASVEFKLLAIVRVRPSLVRSCLFTLSFKPANLSWYFASLWVTNDNHSSHGIKRSRSAVCYEHWLLAAPRLTALSRLPCEACATARWPGDWQYGSMRGRTSGSELTRSVGRRPPPTAVFLVIFNKSQLLSHSSLWQLRAEVNFTLHKFRLQLLHQGLRTTSPTMVMMALCHKLAFHQTMLHDRPRPLIFGWQRSWENCNRATQRDNYM